MIRFIIVVSVIGAIFSLVALRDHLDYPDPPFAVTGRR